jgi:nicotinamide-nucleotide amidase
VRRRLGNFVVAEDESSLERVVLEKLKAGGHTLAIGETFTSGAIASRLAPLPGAETVFCRGMIGADVAADKLRTESGASHALAVLMQLDEGADRPDFGATITVQIADQGGMVQRVARLVGGRDWVRTGATELGLDCLRRHLLGLPVDERIDFERR